MTAEHDQPNPEISPETHPDVSMGLAASSRVQSPLGPIAKAGNLPFLAVIKVYRLLFSPILGGQCRFEPTCSRYAAEAYRLHGPLKGTQMTMARICRCQPWNKGGFDPVSIPETPQDHSPESNRIQTTQEGNTDGTTARGPKA